jgi:hypothetical protein
LNLDDYNELVVSGRLRLTLPPAGAYPMEDVVIDPTKVAQHERPLRDLAGSVCTEAWCADNRTLHLRFSRWHRIEVDEDPHAASWGSTANAGKRPACRANGSAWRHDIPDDADIFTEIPSAAS